jgi:hypothetical protein
MKCDFDKLVLYLDKKLKLDEQLALFEHLDGCPTCFEAIYLLSRDRDSELFAARV